VASFHRLDLKKDAVQEQSAFSKASKFLALFFVEIIPKSISKGIAKS
jgi:hypothetical protein